ncbi:tRNA nucleotidyltransferase (CCA-adding enzyme) [Methanococcus voltae]|uniref:CCA-adding enzyme n=1 Tax=Methanococcus voltae TaxID=2188 RepID=A0A8J7RLL8_METVO|nr:CCA tRNA nucleotidyltransferase [Methanococcus voltae]MBP2201081.1 tRNA nucleotidyltransferase (CCA-adding enzyme) [Methanococcus voltae]
MTNKNLKSDNNAKIQSILREVLGDVKPCEDEKNHLTTFSKKIIDTINEMKEYPILNVVRVGSTARGTNLKNDHDIDIFLKFDKNTDREELKEIGLNFGIELVTKLNGKYWVKYAEHPYITAKIDKFSLDLVPCYDIQWGEKLISSVDRTPLHNEFLLNAYKRYEKYCKSKKYESYPNGTITDDVIILKRFLKGIGLYGSDLKTAGFSGYLCELLIYYYGGFINLLNSAKKWKAGKKILLTDILEIYNIKSPEWNTEYLENPNIYFNEHYANINLINLNNSEENNSNVIKLKEYKFLDNKYYKNQPLVIYDPSDLDRNVAAALSTENFYKFVLYARKFLEDPNIEYFYDYDKKVLNNLNDREKGYELCLKIPRNPEIVDDIIYPQMDRLQKSISHIFEENDFAIVRFSNHANESFCYISWEFLISKMPDLMCKMGPPIYSPKGVDNFIAHNPKYFVKEDRLYAYCPRKYKSVDELLYNIVEGKLQKIITYPKYVNPEEGEILKDKYIERI